MAGKQDPSPEAIRQGCAEIQAGWSPADYDRHHSNAAADVLCDVGGGQNVGDE